MAELTGACLCGTVRYTITGGPHSSGICHCRHCQRTTGTAFSVVLIVPEADLHVTGPLATFEDRGDSGKPVHRRFCGTCGSPVRTDVEAMPGVVFVKAGTLDDTSVLQPSVQIYCDRAMPCAPLIPETQNYPGAMGA